MSETATGAVPGPAASAPPTAEAKASAESILGAPRPPVTRYRRQIVAVGATGLLVVFGLALMIGFSPRRSAPAKPEGDANPSRTSASLAGPDFGGLAKSYGDPDGPIGQAPPLATLPAAGEAGGLVGSVVPAPLSAAPTPGAAPQLSPDQQQSLELARMSRAASPFFSQEQPQGAPARSPSPGFAPAEPASTAPAPAGSGPPSPRILPADAVQNMQAQKLDFIAGSAIKTDYVGNPYQRPLSPYEVKAGAVIPAALVTALNSDLPGEVIAQVTQNVFDHATGRFILIPQGARLLGRYDSQVAYGQNRALIVWNRIIMPDGRSLNIGSMTGADLTGASGLQDQVDSHVGPLTRAIALSTAITVGGAVAQNASARSSGNLVLNDAAGGVSSESSQVGQRYVDKALNRQPTIKVRPGWPLTVLVSRDLVLEPY